MADPHCETCICFDPHALEHFNRRCHRLLTAVRFDVVSEMPAAISVRLPAGRYGLGFTGWKLSSGNNHVAGQFLAALYPADAPPSLHSGLVAGVQFFAVCTYGPIQLGLIERPGVTKLTPCVEHYAGYVREFDISDSPTAEDIEMMVEWDDSTLSEYLRLHLDALQLRIEREVAGG